MKDKNIVGIKVDDKILHEEIKNNNEIINDAFWLGFILKIKKRINDYSIKEFLSSFLIFFSSIFCEETLKSKYGGLSGKRKITEKEIYEYRMYNLKYVHNINSEITKKVMQEMGINFEEYVFDIYFYVIDNNVLDINFKNWHLYNDDKFELYDGIVATPYRWIETSLPPLYPMIESKIENIINNYINSFNNSKIDRKSYSCYRLFINSNISTNEKLYILQMYGLIKSSIFIRSVFNYDMDFKIGPLKIDSRKFWIKIKAIIIELFWENYKSNPLDIMGKIFKKNQKILDEKFYSLNRKVRDNIHYNYINEISDKEYEFLDKQQDIYLLNVISEFDKQLNVSFDEEYFSDYNIAKKLYEDNK